MCFGHRKDDGQIDFEFLFAAGAVAALIQFQHVMYSQALVVNWIVITQNQLGPFIAGFRKTTAGRDTKVFISIFIAFQLVYIPENASQPVATTLIVGINLEACMVFISCSFIILAKLFVTCAVCIAECMV